jgi:hypothetical protein
LSDAAGEIAQTRIGKTFAEVLRENVFVSEDRARREFCCLFDARKIRVLDKIRDRLRGGGRESRTILLNGAGWTARKTPAAGEVFFP